MAIWNAASLEKVAEVQAAAPVYALHALSDGRLIGTGEVGVVWMWKPGENGSIEAIGELNEMHQVRALAVSAGGHGTFVITGGGVSAISRPFDNASYVVRVWGLRDGLFRTGLLFELSGHEDSISGLAASPIEWEYTVFSASSDGSLRVFDLVSRKQTLNLTANRSFLTCVACSPHGHCVATGGTNGEVRLWETIGRDPVQIASGVGVVPLRSLATGKSNIFATNDNIGRLRLWSVFPLQQLAELAPHGNTRYGLSFSSDDRFLAAGTRSSQVQIWNVQERVLSRIILAGWLGFINSTAFSAHGRLAACGTGGAVVWNARDWKEECSIRSFGKVHGVGFTDDLLILLSPDGTLRTWDLRSNRLRRTISTGHESADTLTVHPHAPIVAIADTGNSVQTWSLATGRRLQTLVGHRRAVRTIAFSQDGKTLASGGFDDRIVVWDHEVGVKRTAFTCAKGTVCELGFSDGGKTLLVAGGGEFGAIEHRIHAWDAVVR